jgi:hypothetical protein
MKRIPFRSGLLVAVVVAFSFFGSTSSVAATQSIDPVTLTTNLNNLVVQGSTLVATMAKVSLTSTNMSTQLLTLETSVVTYLNAVGDVYKYVSGGVGTSTFSVTSDMLLALQNLSAISYSLSSELMRLSALTVTLASATSLTTLQTSMTAMLRLSDDIGVMADRILEMADKILIMADNIGLMADRILATQVIQGDNIALIVDATLQTQQNTILLIDTFLQ